MAVGLMHRFGAVVTSDNSYKISSHAIPVGAAEGCDGGLSDAPLSLPRGARERLQIVKNISKPKYYLARKLFARYIHSVLS